MLTALRLTLMALFIAAPLGQQDARTGGDPARDYPRADARAPFARSAGAESPIRIALAIERSAKPASCVTAPR